MQIANKIAQENNMIITKSKRHPETHQNQRFWNQQPPAQHQYQNQIFSKLVNNYYKNPENHTNHSILRPPYI